MITMILGALVGLDNLAVGSGLGMLGLDRRRRLWFAASCFGFETLASAIGTRLGLGLQEGLGTAVGRLLAPICLAACGVMIALAVARRAEKPRFLDTNRAMLAIPFLLCLDNLAAGVGQGLSGVSTVLDGLAAGLLSGCMAAMGFVCGGWIHERSSGYSKAFAGGWLVACALILVFADLA